MLEPQRYGIEWTNRCCSEVRLQNLRLEICNLAMMVLGLASPPAETSCSGRH
jgi:hypothetical protein